MSNFSTTAKSVISAIAPTLGMALGGPFGGLAGTVLADALGSKDPKAQEAAIVSSDPNTLAQLKQAELSFKAHMVDAGIQEEQLSFADVASARNLEVSTHDITEKILAYLVTAGFFSVLGGLLFLGKPTAGGDVLLVLLGSLGTAWANIIGYYFGSSAGSALKSDALNKIAVTK